MLDEALFENELKAQVALIHEEVGDSAYEQGRFPEAIALFRDLCLHQDFVEFLTLPAYEMLQD